MYSGPDTLAGGFPHSEICGSTIARISPQLIAACHVLHRLLAPRHPPNALVSLAIPTPAARTQDQTAPRAPTCQDQAASLYAYQRSRALFLNQSQMHNFNERHRSRTSLHQVGLLEATCSRRSTRCPAARSSLEGHRERRAEPARSAGSLFSGRRSRAPKCPSHVRSLKGGDPAAGSPTATLLRLHPSH